MPVAKKAKKKVVVPRGIHLRKSSKGFSMHVHASNGNKLAVLTGYDTKQAAHKSLSALEAALRKARRCDNLDSPKPRFYYSFTDHTVVAKKVAKKK